jgi:RimJ/RimL family protein N-acetyltransferase
MRRPRTSDPVEGVQEQEGEGEAGEPDRERSEVEHGDLSVGPARSTSCQGSSRASEEFLKMRGVLRPAYPIETARLRLRPFEAGDLEALHAIQSREDVARYLYWGPRSLDEVRDALADRMQMTVLEAEGQTLVLAAVLRDSGELVGDVNLRWLSEAHRQGEVGYVFHPDHHGHGYAVEATAEVLRLGFEELALHRIVARCDGRNVASTRLMERLGMRREAHLRENELVKGVWTDELVFALLAREWRAARATG